MWLLVGTDSVDVPKVPPVSLPSPVPLTWAVHIPLVQVCSREYSPLELNFSQEEKGTTSILTTINPLLQGGLRALTGTTEQLQTLQIIQMHEGPGDE